MKTPIVTLVVAAPLSVVVLGGAALVAAQRDSSTPNAMPVAEQNELVMKRCIPCHDARQRKGGLSLERFNAADPDPDIARLMMVKITGDNATAAAGQPSPDRETVDAFVGALSRAAAKAPIGAASWKVDLTTDPATPGRGHPFVTARATQEAPVPGNAAALAVYELTVSCNGAVRRPDIQVATFTRASTQSPLMPRANSNAPKLEWPRSMDALSVSGMFPAEQVGFPLGTLSPTIRDIFSWCFESQSAGR
jgi:hypothetical protein